MSGELTILDGGNELTLLDGGNELALIADAAELDIEAEVGIPGQRGAEGTSQHFDHVQAAETDVWTINHNLGFRPSVALFSGGGEAMWATVLHVSANQTLVYFLSPTSGTARLT